MPPMTITTANPTVEHLLAVTESLIYKGGISATGMDLIVTTSGVSRKTIYKHFGSKDGLIAEALRRRDERWMSWFIDNTLAIPTPRERLLNMFTLLGEWFQMPGFRGCAFINAAGEIGDPADPIRQVARDHKLKLLHFVEQLVREYKRENSRELAEQLLILIDGAITLALVMGDTHAASRAQQIARTLLTH
jgi:AcrR family transcriptional regulator